MMKLMLVGALAVLLAGCATQEADNQGGTGNPDSGTLRSQGTNHFPHGSGSGTGLRTGAPGSESRSPR